MEAFHKRYLRTCREHQIIPLECVISQVSKEYGDGKSILSLASYNLTPEDCHALASSLTDDFFFKEITFADCLLSEESCKLILLGLMQNKCLTTLNLKGNNIRCGGAEVLGQFLKRNTSVHSLQLEWNSLGLWDSGIVAVAEGLALNQVLLILDLRNNQITHEGAAHLSAALKRNQTLKGIDLRWNNIGILGGREILSAFKYNKTLTCIELTGNNIPQDILRAVSVATRQNSDQQILDKEHRNRTDMMAKELEKAENLKMKEVLSLKNEIDKERTQHEIYCSSTQKKIDQLKSTLDERKNAFDSLSAKLTATEAELSLVNQKCKDLNHLSDSLRQELHSEREERTTAELQHHKELNKVLEKNIELDANVNMLERKNKTLHMTMNELEKEIEKLSSEFSLKSKESDHQFQNELRSTKERLEKDLHDIHQKMSENSQNAREKIRKIEEHRNSLEKEVSSLKSEIVSIKLQADEETMNIKAQLKQDENMRSRQYEERIHLIQASRDELQLQCNKQLAQISDLQSQISLITRECDSQKRQVETLKQQVDEKDVEYNKEVTRLKFELDAERKSARELRDNVSNLEDKLTEITKKQREIISTKENEIEFLKDQLKTKDNELKQHHSEELKRAEMLEKAIYSFVSSTRTASH